MNWYYAENAQQQGPVSESELEGLVRAGRITADTLVWREGMANWQPYAQVKPDVGGSPSTPPVIEAAAPVSVAIVGGEAVCSECGQMFPKDQVIQYGNAWICAACKPLFIQKLKEGAQLAPSGEALIYAGFWIRFAAKLIDILILTLVLVVPFVVLIVHSMANSGGRGQVPEALFGQIQLLQLLGIPFVVAYNTFFQGKFGATPGKMACGLKVVTAEGDRITYLRAFGRAWAEQLSGLICDIGYIIVAFDDQKRALHDHICTTRVIQVR